MAQTEKYDHTNKKRSFSDRLLLRLGAEDSNPHIRIQSPLSYR